MFLLSGHYEFFKKMAEEEREHANKFMEYQNKRGGTIVLLDIKVCCLVCLLFPFFYYFFIWILETSTTKLEFGTGST